MDFWGRIERSQKLCGKTSLKEICKKIDVPYQTLANQKTGARLPSLVIVVSLAKELGTTVEWLLYGPSKETKAIEGTRLNALMKRIEELSQAEILALEILLEVKPNKH